MLNHATMKVMEAEKQKTDSEAEHLQRAAFYTAAEQACQRLEKRLKKNVVKSHHYFEQKDAFNKTLEAQKFQVQSLQSKVCTLNQHCTLITFFFPVSPNLKILFIIDIPMYL